MTAALGASFVEPGSPLVSALASALGEPVSALGDRGAPLHRWVRDVERAPAGGARAYVFEMGGNTSSVSVRDIKAAHGNLRAKGWEPVWVPPPVWPEDTPQLVRDRRAAMRTAALSAGVPVVRYEWRPTRADLSRDGMHMTRAGYQAFASAVASAPTAAPRPSVPKALLIAAVGAIVAAVAYRY